MRTQRAEQPARAAVNCRFPRLGAIERETIAQVLRDCRWNTTRAAKRLGLTRTQLYLRLQK